jgi:hypothetical protein
LPLLSINNMLLGNVWRLFCFLATNAGEYILSWEKKTCITLLLSTISVCITLLFSTISVCITLLFSTISVCSTLLFSTISVCITLLFSTISGCITSLFCTTSTCIDLVFSTNQHALLLLTQYVFRCCYNHNRDYKSQCQHREDTHMFLLYIDLQSSKKYNNNFTY